MIRTSKLALPGWGILAVLALSLSGYAWAQSSDLGDADKRAEILSKLRTMKVSLDFRDTPLQDVIDFIREMTGINFVIDQKVYEETEADKLTITIKVDDLELRSALKLMLQMRGLTAVYRDGVLLIVSQKSQEENVFMKIYDVRDLLQPVRDFAGPNISLATGEDGSPQGIDSAAFNTPENNTAMNPDFIVDTIKKACGGSTWDSDKCSIQISNGMLIVVQSRAVQDEVNGLIDQLRQYK